MPYQYRKEYRFLGFFCLFMVCGIFIFFVMLSSLKVRGSLPAPPLTATYCIDEKFMFMADREIDNVDWLAVGSSVTWRNLDFTPFVASGIAKEPLNAAPCYLYMHQTAFLGEFFLDHLKYVKTIITVVAPRDFEKCSDSDRSFFDTGLAASYMFDDVPPLLIYVINFRPLQFFHDVLAVAERRVNPKAVGPLVMGPFGSGPIEGAVDESIDLPPPTALDDHCFQALTRFEHLLSTQGIRFIVVSFPSRASRYTEKDPQRFIATPFERQLKDSLHFPSTMFISGQLLAPDRSLYVDNVHLNWNGAQIFSAALADQIGSVTSSINK